MQSLTQCSFLCSVSNIFNLVGSASNFNKALRLSIDVVGVCVLYEFIFI